MLAPLANGALDNTLAQSAFSWFENPNGQILDANAEKSFCDFVDAYIYVRRRYTPLPGRSLAGSSVREPFVSLWQENAQHLTFASAQGAGTPEDDVWDPFLWSLHAQQDQWVRWLRFQWTPAVFAAFAGRVGDWEAQLDIALSRIEPALRRKGGGSVPNFVADLTPRLDASSVDGAYVAFAVQRRLPLAVIATAYAWNWFLRGARYAGITNGMAVRFHNLRCAAIVAPRRLGTLPRPADWGIEWGTIIGRCLAEGVIKRDTEQFCETLRIIRNSVQEGADYAECVERAERAEGAERVRWQHNAIGRALVRAGTCPPFNGTTRRGAVLSAVAKSVIEHTTPDSLGFLQKAAYEIVDLSINSMTFRRFEYELREFVANESLWKVFQIPGQK